MKRWCKMISTYNLGYLDLLGRMGRKARETIATDPSGPSGCRTSRRTGLEAGFYFAPPYSSWERGLNENTNGLIRQYFPKSRDFTTITDSDTQAVMDKLNNRPRKCLGFKTPNQVFFGIKPDVALSSRTQV